jgi:hypothetical protein
MRVTAVQRATPAPAEERPEPPGAEARHHSPRHDHQQPEAEKAKPHGPLRLADTARVGR